MFLYETCMESIMTGGHRRMSGENNFPRDPSDGFLKTDAFVLHPRANRFQQYKPAVPFVQMENTRSDPHRSEGTEGSNTKQEVLANSNTHIAAVQTRCQVTILRRIACNV